MFELFFAVGGDNLFDLIVMHIPLWRTDLEPESQLNLLPEIFQPLENIGKVMIVGAEGDQFISKSRQLRNAVIGPSANRNYRLYEVAGAPHFPLDMLLPLPGGSTVRTNPLDNGPVVRSIFLAGDRWVRFGWRPPRTALLRSNPDGTGIARDADGNALGGVRFPDVEVGRAQFVASIPEEILPGFPGLVGIWFDLACAPPAGSSSDAPRFRNHGSYVRGVVRQTALLRSRGYLLRSDARQIISEAVHSDIGRPGTCEM